MIMICSKTLFLLSGTDNVNRIKTDKWGRMIPEELEAALAKVKKEDRSTPLMVNATFGTTVLGAIDPIDASSK